MYVSTHRSCSLNRLIQLLYRTIHIVISLVQRGWLLLCVHRNGVFRSCVRPWTHRSAQLQLPVFPSSCRCSHTRCPAEKHWLSEWRETQTSDFTYCRVGGFTPISLLFYQPVNLRDPSGTPSCHFVWNSTKTCFNQCFKTAGSITVQETVWWIFKS